MGLRVKDFVDAGYQQGEMQASPLAAEAASLIKKHDSESRSQIYLLAISRN